MSQVGLVSLVVYLKQSLKNKGSLWRSYDSCYVLGWVGRAGVCTCVYVCVLNATTGRDNIIKRTEEVDRRVTETRMG